MTSRLGPGVRHELRIHGVAGTPAEAMLDDLVTTSPVPDACGNEPAHTSISIAGRADSEAETGASGNEARRVLAYSWGSVTSGSVTTALYLLLLPYLFINLAGWAALPGQLPGESSLDDDGADRPWRVRVVTTAVRVSGLAVTVIFAQWALLIGTDIVAYQWGVRLRGFDPWVMALGVLLAASMVEIQRWVTRLRLRPGSQPFEVSPLTTDPVGYAWITHEQRLLWDSPGVIALQRNAHLAAAHGSIALVGVAMVSQWADMPSAGLGQLARAVASPVGWIALGVGVALPVWQSLSAGRRTPVAVVSAARASPWLARLAVLVAALVIGTAGFPDMNVGPSFDGTSLDGSGFGGDALGPGGSYSTLTVDDLSMDTLDGFSDLGIPLFLPVIRGVGLGLTIGLAVWLMLSGALAFIGRRPGERTWSHWAPFNVTGFLLLGGAVAGGIGAAGATAVSALLDSENAVIIPGPLPEALAISFATLAIGVGWVMLVGFAIRWRQVSGESNAGQNGSDQTWIVRLTTAVQRLLSGGSWMMAVLTIGGVVGIVLLVLLNRAAENPLVVLEGLSPVPELIVVTAVGLPLGAVALGLAARFKPALGLVVFIIGLAAVAITVTLLPGDTVARQIRPAALGIGLLLPASAIAGKGFSALRSRADRRSIAVLWDVGTFFPRWFHPMSPPSYGDRVVTDLTELITEEVGDPDDSRSLILTPHSQGTVIAAAAVLGTPVVLETDRLALLTYGSPLRQFYGEFFPRLFGPQTTAALAERLGGSRWINLMRASDPIAAPVGIPTVDRVIPLDPCSRWHLQYPREAAYVAAVDDLETQIPTA